MPSCQQQQRGHRNDKRKKVKLQREINVLHATAVMTGVMIGSGIFVSPVSVIRHCGSVGLSLIMWGVSGAVTLCIALCYTEMAGMFPQAGAEYSYFLNALGRLPAFLNVWLSIVTATPCFVAILGITTIDYIIYPLFPDCATAPAAKIILSVVIVLFVTAINSVYVRYVVRFQTGFMILKFLALLLIILGGVIHAVKGNTDASVYSFENSTRNPGSICVAMFSGVFTYAGWTYLFNLMEEIRNPVRVVPRSVYISMATVTILYLLTNAAYFAVMSPDTMMASDAVAVTFASRVYGPIGTAIMPILVATSTLGALNGTLLGSTRKYYAIARDRMFPAIMSSLHVQYDIPWIAVFATSGVSLIYILSGDAIQLIEYLGFVDSLFFLTACSCVAYLRYQRPTTKRTFKTPFLVVVIAIVVLAAACLLALYEKPYSNGIGVVCLLSGIPAYCLGVLWKKPAGYNKQIKRAYDVLQKTFLVVFEDEAMI